MHDDVNDQDAKMELRLQGLNRTKRRIITQTDGKQQPRTTSGDKHFLR
jgi:hypothetical protein